MFHDFIRDSDIIENSLQEYVDIFLDICNQTRYPFYCSKYFILKYSWLYNVHINPKHCELLVLVSTIPVAIYYTQENAIVVLKLVYILSPGQLVHFTTISGSSS